MNEDNDPGDTGPSPDQHLGNPQIEDAAMEAPGTPSKKEKGDVDMESDSTRKRLDRSPHQTPSPNQPRRAKKKIAEGAQLNSIRRQLGNNNKQDSLSSSQSTAQRSIEEWTLVSNSKPKPTHEPSANHANQASQIGDGKSNYGTHPSPPNATLPSPSSPNPPSTMSSTPLAQRVWNKGQDESNTGALKAPVPLIFTKSKGVLPLQKAFSTPPPEGSILYQYLESAQASKIVSPTFDMKTFGKIGYDVKARGMPLAMTHHLRSHHEWDVELTADDLSHTFRDYYFPPQLKQHYTIQPEQGKYATVAHDSLKHMHHYLEESRGFLMHPNYYNNRGGKEKDKEKAGSEPEVQHLTAWAQRLADCLKKMKGKKPVKGWFVLSTPDPHVQAKNALLLDYRRCLQVLHRHTETILSFQQAHFHEPGKPENWEGEYPQPQPLAKPFTQTILAVLVNSEVNYNPPETIRHIDLNTGETLASCLGSLQEQALEMVTLRIDVSYEVLPKNITLRGLYTWLHTALQQHGPILNNGDRLTCPATGGSKTSSPLEDYTRFNYATTRPLAEAIIQALMKLPFLDYKILPLILEDVTNPDYYYVVSTRDRVLTPQQLKQNEAQVYYEGISDALPPGATIKQRLARNRFSLVVQVDFSECGDSDMSPERQFSLNCRKDSGLLLFSTKTLQLVGGLNNNPTSRIPQSHSYRRDPTEVYRTPLEERDVLLSVPNHLAYPHVQQLVALAGTYETIEQLSRDDPFQVAHPTYKVTYQHEHSCYLAHCIETEGAHFDLGKKKTPPQDALKQIWQHNDLQWGDQWDTRPPLPVILQVGTLYGSKQQLYTIREQYFPPTQVVVPPGPPSWADMVDEEEERHPTENPPNTDMTE